MINPRLALTVMLCFLAGCEASDQPVASICSLSQFPLGWSGADVRVTGIALGSLPHGFGLVDATCDRAIELETADREVLLSLFNATQNGLVTIDVSGKFLAREHRGLLGAAVSHASLTRISVHSLKVKAMSEAGRRSYWQARMQRRRDIRSD